MPYPLAHAARGMLKRRRNGEKLWDFDVVEGVIRYLPILVIAPFHFWNWRLVSSNWTFQKRTNVYTFRAMPIRWSVDLLVRTYLRVWIWVPMFLGFCTIWSCNHSIWVRLVGFLVFLACVACWFWLLWRERIDRDIRRLLGRHRLGTSDPLSWPDDLLDLLEPCRAWFETPSFALAVETLLNEERWSDAMWAARLCAALEDADEGQRLTVRILREERVRTVLRKLKRNPERAREWLNRRHPRRFPLVRAVRGKSAEFWHVLLVEKRTETEEDVEYAHHVFGTLAMAVELPTREQREKERADLEFYYKKNRAGPHQRLFVLGGMGLFASLVVFVIGYCQMLAATQLPPEPLLVQPPPAAGQQPAPPKPDGGAPPAQNAWWNQPEQGAVQYLTDMAEFDVKEGPWKLGKQGTLGNPEGNAITVGGARSPKGLGMHPPDSGYAQVKYRLLPRARRFKAAVALDDTAGAAPGEAVFEVWGDGQLLWQSKPQREKALPEECAIDVAQVDVLELRVNARGSHFGLHATWLEPRLLMK